MLNKKEILPILDLKKITSSNNFFPNKKKIINIKLGINVKTGALRLIKKNNINLIKTPHNWLKNKEPEFHIKLIANKILSLAKKRVDVKNILCLTYKDISLASRIKKILKKRQIKIIFAAKILSNNVGIKTQEILFKIENSKINKKKGKYDLIIIRHSWEHIFEQQRFIKNLLLLSNPNTIYYFEVPDCERLIKNFDYTMIWEEHIFYYTQKTFLNSLRENGFSILKFVRFKQDYEDILCAVVVKSESNFNINKSLSSSNKNEINIAKKYAKKFNYFKSYFQKKITKISKNGDIIAYGASHMLNIFFNIFKIEKYIKYIIDDNQFKHNKFMFKNNIIIKKSKLINRTLPNSCILAINPMSNLDFDNKIKYLKNNNVKIFSLFKKLKQI
jgi:hypothetical protein